MKQVFGCFDWRSALSLVPVLLSSLVGCTEQAKLDELVVVVESGLSSPQDIDHLRLQVTRDGQTLFSQEQDLGPVTLPLSLRVSAPQSSSPATIVGVVFKGGVPRVERTAVTPIPSGRVGELHLSFDARCEVWTGVDVSGRVISKCPDGQTCIEGVCQGWLVPESALFSPRVPGGTATADASSPACADAQACDASTSPEHILGGPTSPIGQACVGAFATACGQCGVVSRACTNGKWSDWSACAHEGPCVPGTTLACGDGGITRCGNNCQWLSCDVPSECDAAQTRPCGVCGTQARACVAGRWGEWGVCESTPGCADASVDARACEVNATRCVGNVVETCSEDGAWVRGETCPFQCAQGACRGECTTGSRRCSGKVAQTCGVEGAWSSDITCPNVCTAGECTGVCVPGSKQCNGNVAQVCGDDGTWKGDVTCPNVCVAGVCAGSCVPSSKQCSGNEVQTCGADGTWSTGASCPYVCVDGDCAGICVPGRKQCSGKAPQVCGADGAWKTGANCPYVCAAGACTGVCVPGAKQCDGKSAQVCAANGTWATSTTCPYLCTDGACTGTCTPGDTGCSGKSPQTCDASGKWIVGAACSDVCVAGRCEVRIFKGCRGTGQHVCDELVDPHYFDHHTSCKQNPTCDGQYYNCGSDCPVPTPEEIPNVVVKAAGAPSSNASLQIGYMWTSCVPGYCTGGMHSSSVSPGATWSELTSGAGVHVPNGEDATVICNNYQSDVRLAEVSVAWVNGETQTFPCDGYYCNTVVPSRSGFTASCVFAMR